MNAERDYALDIMRLVAIAAVVMVHVSADFMLAAPPGSGGFMAATILDSCSQFAAPLFFMVSGALLLPSDRPFGFRKMIRYVARTVGLLVCWLAIYELYHATAWTGDGWFSPSTEDGSSQGPCISGSFSRLSDSISSPRSCGV